MIKDERQLKSNVTVHFNSWECRAIINYRLVAMKMFHAVERTSLLLTTMVKSVHRLGLHALAKETFLN